MCSVDGCTRKCYKDTPCCWIHRGKVGQFAKATEPEVALEVTEVVESKPVEVDIDDFDGFDNDVDEVKPTENLFEYTVTHRGDEYSHWINKHAKKGYVSFTLYIDGLRYCHETKDAHVLQVVDGNGKNRRYVWLYDYCDRSAFVKFAHEQLKHECHEVFIGGRKIKFFIDCDQKLSNAQFEAFRMTSDQLVQQMAADYMTVFGHALEYNDAYYDRYADGIDYLVTNRSRKLPDNSTKISTHIVTNVAFSVAECKAIVKYMLQELFIALDGVSDEYINFLKACVDVQPYRKNGSLSLPGGNKNETTIHHTSGHLLEHSLTDELNVKFEEKSREVFEESSSEFINKAIQNVKKIEDYDESKMDVYGRLPKGNFLYVKRTGKSYCSVCKRDHESDDTMLLIFNEEKQSAWWKCTHAPSGIKAKRWYGKGKQEIMVDDNTFSADEIAEFKAVASDSTKPSPDRKLTTAQLLKLKLIEKIGVEYRRAYGTGAIYQRKTDFYYTYKYNDPKLFLNDMFADDEMYHLCSSKDSNELIQFIKSTVHPKFPFIELSYDYIGFTNGVYNLSTAKFIELADIPKNVQVRKYINQEFRVVDTPMFDKYLSFQFDDPEVREFIYFLLGRCLTRLDDKFDFMVMLKGQGGSGKSLLANLIKHAFGNDQVGLLSASFQNIFGLSEFANKQIVCCDDMPHNIAKTLPRSFFLSMMTRGAISCPVKGKISIDVADWNIPTIINSNHMPNYKDESGEIVRRTMIVEFSKQVPFEEVDIDLEDKIKGSEFPSLLHRFRSTYLAYKTKYKGKAVRSFMPRDLIENSDNFRAEANNSFGFAISKVVFSEGNKVSRASMRSHMLDWIKEKYSLMKVPKEQLNPQEICRIDNRIKYVEEKICRYCGNRHKKG
ncbi:TPA: hypothetical protein N0F65_012900, partial [Lagenidium giganteum]